jgi:F-type H+-transporting ATPase subunit delta
VATAAARRYARAVYELAVEEGQVAEWRTRLAILRDLLSDPKVAAVLTNPTIPAVRRMEVIAAAERVLDAEATNLGRLLIEARRVDQVVDIVSEFERLADEADGLVLAVVTTAVELSPEDRERIAEQLSQRLRKQVRLSVVVDPRIVGGLKLQYGDHVIDATLATRLHQLRRRLADAS